MNESKALTVLFHFFKKLYQKTPNEFDRGKKNGLM